MAWKKRQLRGIFSKISYPQMQCYKGRTASTNCQDALESSMLSRLYPSISLISGTSCPISLLLAAFLPFLTSHSCSPTSQQLFNLDNFIGSTAEKVFTIVSPTPLSGTKGRQRNFSPWSKRKPSFKSQTQKRAMEVVLTTSASSNFSLKRHLKIEQSFPPSPGPISAFLLLSFRSCKLSYHKLSQPVPPHQNTAVPHAQDRHRPAGAQHSLVRGQAAHCTIKLSQQ